MITIHIDARKAENMMNGLIENIPKATARGLNKFSESLASKLRKASLKHKFTGLLSSEKGFRSVRLDQGVYAIYAPYYLTYLEEGTGPHFIPKIAKTMGWAASHKMSFHYMRATIARKGTQAYPFVQAVIASSVKRLIGRTVEKELNNTIQSKGRR